MAKYESFNNTHCHADYLLSFDLKGSRTNFNSFILQRFTLSFPKGSKPGSVCRQGNDFSKHFTSNGSTPKGTEEPFVQLKKGQYYHTFS